MRSGNLLICAALFSISFAGARAAVAQAGNEKSPPHPLDIRVVGGDWGGGQVRDIQKVCHSAAMELWPYFAGRRLRPIVVSRSHEGPITLYQRLEQGQYQVRLDSEDNLWAQFSFQFAHEFCHVLCNYDDDEHPNRWFEESICELASLFALRRMAETWNTSPPYPNWKSYAPHLKDYADNRMREIQQPASTSLAEWYGENAQQLYAGAAGRERNRIVAAALLPLFEQQPQHWEAVGYLNCGKGFKKQSFQQYMQDWEYFAPERHKGFIKGIGKMFDVDRHGAAPPTPLAIPPAGT